PSGARRHRFPGCAAGAVAASDHRRSGRSRRPPRDRVRGRVDGWPGPPGSRQQLLRSHAMTQKLPIWRNPVLILVFLLPAISIIAGVGLLVMALRTGGDDPVLDEVRRTARGAQVTDLSADQAAQAGRFAAVVRVDPENGAVEVFPVSGRFTRNAPLQLVLGHPVQSSADVSLELAPSDNGWRAEAEIDTGHDWNLRLSPGDGEWRLQGRLESGELAARVPPALQAAGAAP